MIITKKAIENEIEIKKVWDFLKNIWIQFNDVSNYILAFIHRSIVNERPDFAPEHNERLEFLWDAVLELSITDNLFKNFPDKPEWELTDIRSAIVRWKKIEKIARELKIK
jgi:ribonuclease-3